jgi:hypothetical protein
MENILDLPFFYPGSACWPAEMVMGSLLCLRARFWVYHLKASSRDFLILILKKILPIR